MKNNRNLMNFDALLTRRYMNADFGSMIRDMVVTAVSLRSRRRRGHGAAAAGRGPFGVNPRLRGIRPSGRLFHQQI